MAILNPGASPRLALVIVDTEGTSLVFDRLEYLLVLRRLGRERAVSGFEQICYRYCRDNERGTMVSVGEIGRFVADALEH